MRCKMIVKCKSGRRLFIRAETVAELLETAHSYESLPHIIFISIWDENGTNIYNYPKLNG